MKKQLLFLTSLVAVLLLPMASYAQTDPSTNNSQLITVLTALVQVLEQEITALESHTTASPTAVIPTSTSETAAATDTATPSVSTPTQTTPAPTPAVTVTQGTTANGDIGTVFITAGADPIILTSVAVTVDGAQASNVAVSADGAPLTNSVNGTTIIPTTKAGPTANWYLTSPSNIIPAGSAIKIDVSADGATGAKVVGFNAVDRLTGDTVPQGATIPPYASTPAASTLIETPTTATPAETTASTATPETSAPVPAVTLTQGAAGNGYVGISYITAGPDPIDLGSIAVTVNGDPAQVSNVRVQIGSKLLENMFDDGVINTIKVWPTATWYVPHPINFVPAGSTIEIQISATGPATAKVVGYTATDRTTGADVSKHLIIGEYTI